MSNITVDTDALRDAGSALGETISELNALYERIQHIISNLGETWEGEACKEFIAKMSIQSGDILTIAKLLEEYKKYANVSSAAFEAVDGLFDKLCCLEVQ